MKEKNIHKHSHSHHHSHNIPKNQNILKVVLLNFSITLVQIVGGILSNSLSLLSDALHNLGDSLAIFIAFWANKFSRKSANKHYTF